MFALTSSALFLALPLFVSAIPTGDPSNQCNTGSLQCCQSTQSPTSANAAGGLLGLLGIVAPLTGLVGLQCSGLNIIGVSGSSCSAQPVCCTGNTFNGLIALGCTPVNLNL